MSEQVFLDTGFFIAFINSEDNYHNQAVEFLTSAYSQGKKFYMSDYVLDEFLTWMRCKQKLPVDKVIGVINTLSTSDIQVYGVTRELVNDSIQLMKKYKDQYFSFTDCVSFEMMKELKIKEVATTDKHFSAYGFNNLLSLL